MEPDSTSVQPTRLFNRNFFLLWQGQFVSQLGNQVHAIALMLWIKHATGSASLMGMIMMFSMLPGVLLGPFGGTLADRHSRRVIIIICDLLSGIAVISLAALLFYAPDRVPLVIVWLFTVSILLGLIGAFFRPAISAAIPDLVPQDKIATANSLNQSSIQVSSLLGQGVGGVLFRVLGAPFLFLADGLSYIFSGSCTLMIKIPQTIPEKGSGFKTTLRQFTGDTREGFRYIWQRKGMRDVFFAASFLNFFLSPLGVLFPFYVEDHLHATPDWFGFIMAAFGVGALIGYGLVAVLRLKGRERSNLVMFFLVLISVAFAGLGLVKVPYQALLITLMMGLLAGVINVNIITILQTTTPSEIRGRIFGVLGTITAGLMPIGMGLAGVVAGLLDNNVPLIYFICGIISMILTFLLSLSRNFRDYLAYEPDAENNQLSS